MKENPKWARVRVLTAMLDALMDSSLKAVGDGETSVIRENFRTEQKRIDGELRKILKEIEEEENGE